MGPKVRLGVVLATLAIGVTGCDGMPGLFPGPLDRRVILSSDAFMLDAKPTRFAKDGQIRIEGMTSEICAALSRDAHVEMNAKAEARRPPTFSSGANWSPWLL